jgi:hypothetical protein
MPIESIVKIGIGFLFGIFAWAAAGSFIHRRAIKLTEGRLESAFQQLMARALADKELMQTALEHAKAQMLVLEKKESVIGRLATELEALKAEFGLLKSKFEATYPEQPAPFSPARSRAVLEGAWSRGNRNREFSQEDTWTRDETFNEMPLVPTVSEIPSIKAPIDTRPRCARENERRAALKGNQGD